MRALAYGALAVGLAAPLPAALITLDALRPDLEAISAFCPAGEVIVVWGDEPTGCNLTGSNRLVILGITEAECDHAGGRWVYEACEDADK